MILWDFSIFFTLPKIGRNIGRHGDKEKNLSRFCHLNYQFNCDSKMTLDQLYEPTPSTGRHISFEIQIGKEEN